MYFKVVISFIFATFLHTYSAYSQIIFYRGNGPVFQSPASRWELYRAQNGRCKISMRFSDAGSGVSSKLEVWFSDDAEKMVFLHTMSTYDLEVGDTVDINLDFDSEKSFSGAAKAVSRTSLSIEVEANSYLIEAFKAASRMTVRFPKSQRWFSLSGSRVGMDHLQQCEFGEGSSARRRVNPFSD
jgi:hypothetical protein